MDLKVGKDRKSWFERNPRKTLLVFFILVLLIAGTAAEIGLRIVFGNMLSYYAGKRDAKSQTIEYPYGTIHLNSHGYPDDEFPSQKTKPRIGYIGDSVCYGVGAGFGFRISELLKEKFPAYEHLNMSSGVSNGIEYEIISNILSESKKFNLDYVVYLMNLNDIVPDDIGEKKYVRALMWLIRLEGALRGGSYLYTYFRWKLKECLVRFGITSHGLVAFELYPEKNRYIILQTTARIQKLNEGLKERGVKFSVVVLPYEMQISKEAEERYATHYRIQWEKDFIDRGPQKIIVNELARNSIPHADAYFAFIDEKDIAKTREKNGLGQFFVFNKGDKIDWNHPNREGHRKIAEYLEGFLRETL
jgi:hypothetical protein